MAQPAPASTLEQLSESYARHLDATDPLPTLRDQFHIPPSPADPREESVYLCGNSLGLQPKATRAALLQELDDWARLGVEGHVHAKHPWLPYHEELRDTAARLVGARPGEVVAMNSLTANLHLMMVSFYRPTAARHRIVIEDSAFPSDSYAVTSQAAFHGFDPRTAVVRLKPRDGEQTLRTDDVESLLEREGKSVALMLLGGVNYLTGQVMDMPRLTAAAHRAGAVAGWDLAHAAGNIAVQLHDWDADFACWCTYKYLNSGPGAVAGCFVHERHGRKTAAYDRMDSPDFLPRFAGWWGNDPATRFKMGPEFTPRDTADAWQLSNPPILALAPYRVSLEIFDKVGIRNLRAKSDRLTAYLQALIDAIPGAERTVEVITPREPGARGAQLSIAVKDRPRDLFKALTADGVLCDFREPNVVRVAPAPLYNTFHDCWRFAQILRTHLARH